MQWGVFKWLVENIDFQDISARDVIEIGSRNENGSIKPYILKFQPTKYLGIDIFDGPDVDIVVDGTKMLEVIPKESFDVVICTEVLEHVRDWRALIHNMKMVLREDGLLIVTTRSIGFGFHAFPNDFWRYEIEDFRNIFSDFKILTLDPDVENGTMIKATKPKEFVEVDISSLALYSILSGKREKEVPKRFKLLRKTKVFALLQFYRLRHLLIRALKRILV